MVDLKDSAIQQAHESISEVLKSNSIDRIKNYITDLEWALGTIKESSEQGGVTHHGVESTLEAMIETLEFAKEDIQNS